MPIKMNWLKHTLVNIVLLILITPLVKPTHGEIYVLLLAGILIDADHLVNDFSKHRVKGKPFKAVIRYWWQAGDSDVREFHFLHNIETITLLFVISAIYSEILLFVSLGLIFHLVGDVLITLRHEKSFKALRKYSAFYFFKGDY